MSEANEYRKGRLCELGGSDWEIVDGQPNIKGWDVKDENGQYLGEVEELIFDPESRKVRYIVLDLEGNSFDLDARDVLVPIGIAALHEKDDDVILRGVTADMLRSLPEYDEDDLNENTEMNIRNSFSSWSSGRATSYTTGVDRENNFYAHEHFDDSNLYSSRRSSTEFRDAADAENSSLLENDTSRTRNDIYEGGIGLRSRMSSDDTMDDLDRRHLRSDQEDSSEETNSERRV